MACRYPNPGLRRVGSFALLVLLPACVPLAGMDRLWSGMAPMVEVAVYGTPGLRYSAKMQTDKDSQLTTGLASAQGFQPIFFSSGPDIMLVQVQKCAATGSVAIQVSQAGKVILVQEAKEGQATLTVLHPFKTFGAASLQGDKFPNALVNLCETGSPDGQNAAEPASNAPVPTRSTPPR